MIRINRAQIQLGFTALELVVTMAITAITFFVATPKLSEILASYYRRNGEMQVLGDMRIAQATTVKEGCHGIFSIASDGKSYSYGCDYVPYSSTYPPAIEKTFFIRRLPSKVQVSSDALVMFNSRGQCIDDSESLATRTVTLSTILSSGSSTFNTGTLRPTGFFSYQN
jgi:type II secretory pathway pseudopilin PulG